MKIKHLATIGLASLFLISCSDSIPTSSEPTSNPTSAPTVFNVNFYDGETLLSTANVNQGEAVAKPIDPVKQDYTFNNWYTDNAFTTVYDFSLPVNNNISLYASFSPIEYFASYNKDYLPDYSILSTDQSFYNDMKDVEFSFNPTLVNLNSNIDVKMVYLFGSLSKLSVESIKVENKVLKVKTKGQLSAGKGYIAFAKEVSNAHVYITSSVNVIERSATIDTNSFRLLEDRDKLDFTINLKNTVLNNPNNLSKEDFIAKANSGEIKCFSVTPNDRYKLEMIEIADDFKAFRLRLTLPSAINNDIADELLKTTVIHIAGEALSSGVSYDFHIDVLNYSTKSEVGLYKVGQNQYKGTFIVRLHSCLLTNTFQDKIGNVLVDPINKNLIVSIDGYEVVVSSLKAVDVTTLSGEFYIAAEEIKDGQASITLGEVQIAEDGSKAHIVKTWYSDEDVIPETEIVNYKFDENILHGGGTGTVTQTANQSYRNVKTEVEISTFSDTGSDSSDVDTLINSATNIGMIGYGLYSGDFYSARAGASKLLGIEVIADPFTKILNSLNSIYDKLVEIERKIDTIIDQLDVIQAELEDLGQQSLLTNYLAAHTAWKAFVTDYYTPLKNQVVSYSNDYFRHFYNLVIDSYNPSEGNEPNVTLYYDSTGELAFPSRNPSLSIEGKTIDKSKTKNVVIPQLNHSLVGLFENNGHVYATIEESIIADLFSYGKYEESLVKDIIRTIRFNAMNKHFVDNEDLDIFSSTFTNFCTAFTSTEFGASTNAGITPLDCYRIMLETVYNFGFEIEPEFNLVTTKIESTYCCSRSILQYVQYINAGEIVSTRYEDLDAAVKKEFTDTRFYHENIDEKTVYCYSTGCYLVYDIDAYGIAFEVTGDYDSGYEEHAYNNRGDNFDVHNQDEPEGLTSIDEASVRLMALKVKLYNDLKGTAFNFGEYLAQIGIIPSDILDKTLGVILEIGDLEDDDDDIEDMKFPSNWAIDCDRAYTFAFTGKAYSFVDGDTVNGLCAITYNAVSTPLGSYVGIGDVTNVGIVDIESGYFYGVWAYFVNFMAVPPNE